MSKKNKMAILPVMLCFFAMGFVDLVGIASNYVKEDLQLSDSTANVRPPVFFLGASSDFSGVDLVMSSNVELVMDRRDLVVGR